MMSTGASARAHTPERALVYLHLCRAHHLVVVVVLEAPRPDPPGEGPTANTAPPPSLGERGVPVLRNQVSEGALGLPKVAHGRPG